jgi:hypothetical protein
MGFDIGKEMSELRWGRSGGEMAFSVDQRVGVTGSGMGTLAAVVTEGDGPCEAAPD